MARRGRDCMIVGFTTTCAISAYHNYSCKFESRLWRGVLDTLCDKVWWFSPGTPVSSTNKTDRHDMTEILLKVALNTIALTLNQSVKQSMYYKMIETRLHVLSIYRDRTCNVLLLSMYDF